MATTATTKPRTLSIKNESWAVKTWVQVDIYVVRWLIAQGYLSESDLPIFNAPNTKPLIDDSPDGGAGEWKKVAEGFYVDVRYSASAHQRNIVACFQQLNVEDVNVTVALGNGEKIELFPKASPAPPDPQTGEAALVELLNRIEAKIDRVEVIAERTDRKMHALTQGFIEMASDLLEEQKPITDADDNLPF